MRIIVVLQDLYDTGANRVSIDRAARWQAAGDDVTVFVTGHETEPTVLTVPTGLPVRRGSRPGRQLRAALPGALANLVRAARRADVVVAGTEVGFGLLLSWAAARVARRPFAVTVQSRPDIAIDTYVELWLRPVTRAALRRVDRAVCVSRALVPAVRDIGTPAGRITVVPNAVPRQDIRRMAEQTPGEPLAVDRPVLVASGRLVHQKGFDLLLRAHARAVELGAAAHQLVILGDGEERESLRQLADELGVGDSVVLPGFSGNPHAVVSRASLFVLSSRWEGFSLVLAEALACGTPCLAFDCVAGPDEVLAGGRYGALVGDGDVEALARGIRDHLADPRDLRARARLAADAPLALFEPDRAAADHRAALAALVGAAAARPPAEGRGVSGSAA